MVSSFEFCYNKNTLSYEDVASRSHHPVLSHCHLCNVVYLEHWALFLL